MSFSRLPPRSSESEQRARSPRQGTQRHTVVLTRYSNVCERWPAKAAIALTLLGHTTIVVALPVGYEHARPTGLERARTADAAVLFHGYHLTDGSGI